jgi:hypothetical protein
VLPPADGHEWLSLTADDGSTWLVDVTFLESGYGCIYGRGCPGIEGAEDHGCCTHGAHFTDAADRKTTLRYASRMRPDEWQYHGRAAAKGGPLKRATGGGWMTRRVDGACIFLNRADHPGGGGCSLHQAALARGERPMDWKPDVCWQVPVRLEIHTDDYGHDTYLLRAWERRDWGEGGADFEWWCIEEGPAYLEPEPVYRTMVDELRELMGDELYARLRESLDRRAISTPVTLTATRRR